MRPIYWLRMLAARLKIAAAARTRPHNALRLAYERLETRLLCAATITNLSLDNTPQDAAWDTDGRYLAFRVEEVKQGADLNGDGDNNDSVLHLFDALSRSSRNLQLAAVQGLFWNPAEDVLLFRVSEAQQRQDLNSDGDVSDSVVHLHFTSDGQTVNSQLSQGSGGWSPGGEYFDLSVSEQSQGSTDLNGDGDAIDSVLHVISGHSGQATNLGVEGVGGRRWSQSGALLIASINEGRQGGDLNGDGDRQDSVLHVFRTATAILERLSISGFSDSLSPDESQLAFRVSEASEAGTDLNGDGDANDFVVHVFNVNTSGMSNLQIDGSLPRWSPDGTRIAIAVHEGRQRNVDLNGDADETDEVVHVVEVDTEVATNLGVDGSVFYTWHSDRYLYVGVSESRQGNDDLNGDGDTADAVIHIADRVDDEVRNLRLVEANLGTDSPDGSLWAFIVSEAEQGANLNGDFDLTDFVLHIYNWQTETVTNLGLAASALQWSGSANYLAISANVTADSSNVYLFQAATGLVTNTGISIEDDVIGNTLRWSPTTDLLAILRPSSWITILDPLTSELTDIELQQMSWSWSPNGNRLVLRVDESRQGEGDLNLDGDTADDVLHSWSLESGLVTNHRLASSSPQWNHTGIDFSIVISEAQQGETDLNRDGDALDLVLHVLSFNSAPIAVDDVTSTLEENAVSGNVLTDGTDDSDPEGDLLFVTQFTVAGDVTVYLAGQTATITGVGTLVIGANGAYTFSPVQDFNGTVPVATYTLSDESLTDTATLALTVTADNDSPTATANTHSTTEAAAVSGNVLTDGTADSDVDNAANTLMVSAVNGVGASVGTQITLASGALLTVNANGSYTYNPNGAFETVNFGASTTDSFQYTVSDPGGLTSVATVTITVNGVDDGFTYSGSSVAVAGTAGADTFQVDLATGVVTRNGVAHDLPAGVTSVSIDGLGGTDTLTLLGTSGAEVVRLLSGQGFLDSSSVGVTGSAMSMEVITYFGNGGADRATFTDSSGNDKFVGRSGLAFLERIGGGSKNTAQGVATVIANASTGGVDTAFLFDTAANNTFTAGQTSATMSGTGITANTFENFVGYAGAGNDSAVLTGGAAKDVLLARKPLATLSGNGKVLSAQGFETVTVNGGTGAANVLDIARLTGVGSVDAFTGGPTSSSLSGSDYRYIANAFETVIATAAGAGDTALLQDSTGNDLFVGQRTSAALINQSLGFSQTAVGFATVTLRGSTGTNRRTITPPLTYTLNQQGTWV